ncbi:sigma 54-interacting transcriptional regulator [candidate division KSB1 bacterium]|nr:sigma 54-interacting transcriptional regulator [candidate division KSB1 bacterium]
MNSNEKLLRAILDSIGDGLFAVDKDFKITSFNRSAERITGFPAKNALGKFCKYVLRTNKCFQDCPLALTLEKAHNIFDYEMVIRDRYAKQIPVKVNTAILFDSNDQPGGGVVSFRDCRPCSALEDELDDQMHFDGIVGVSNQMREIFTLIEEISDSDASVLIQGESGTGKEMVANSIQKRSSRADKPFVKVNCSVFPEALLTSELFGHCKGAFTGAHQDRIGRFEAADEGTIFLDEIAEASPQVQLQLLRVLQDGTFERVGETVTRQCDVRIITATNVNLEQALEKGKFREDLYYRLNVIPLTLPPLRERKADIPFLIQYFLKKYRTLANKPIVDIDDAAIDTFLEYEWPGNVRELENTIAYLFARTKENVITTEKLPSKLFKNRSILRQQAGNPSDETMKLKEVLDSSRWNKTKAAKQLGIGRTTLWRKMKRLGLAEEELT